MLSVECCSWPGFCVVYQLYNAFIASASESYTEPSLPLHPRAFMADQTDAAAVLQGKLPGRRQPSMFSPDHTPALMSANLNSWVLLMSSPMLVDMAGVMSLPCPS